MKIVAIGGGSIGRNGYEYELKSIDEEIVALTGKPNPRLVFIGLALVAGEYVDGYFDKIDENFSALGCKCEYLKESFLPDRDRIKALIDNADIIYVGGGNTLRLMNLFKRYGMVEILAAAKDRGCVMCGVSAGGICWHKFGNSDSRKFTSESLQLIKVSGLGFIDALYCPHYDTEPRRQPDLERMMKRTSGVALAFDNCAALKIDGDNYEVLKCKDTAKARKCFYRNGKYTVTELENSGTVTELTAKP
ncbi:MAG: Type 1 glutamine amidotransferase-like domain-containing protein [Clostridiales bacterium]|nr:Type 1 glutamine amidotransferase-like domain-containing protein [Clostridiales bacterium]